MKGYLGRPEATAESISNGWFRTGDIGHRDADGYYYIVDRAKDMIVRGGFNVYPRLIEFRDSLPMTATGKILKRELRA